MENKYFRAGVGTVIYNDNDKIACFEKASYPLEPWLLQQGGIDAGETTEQTLWRELQEEVGLEKTDIESVYEFPEWTLYTYPPEHIKTYGHGPDRLGQCHRWFYLQLKPGHIIDLTRALEKEFVTMKWITPDELADLGGIRDHIYKDLAHYFTSNIINHENN